ncbi:3-phosphoshikimate 1-carboxyvinyltransferase [Tetragenococcus halophilus subsp. halophilus]|uniref:3-phosphoshikimate 1-carboxyvinyltransferase n=1 Tax=Tetragenococcus halophilus TaxID=51669 RepID=UPI00083E0A4C|nr:3-phosphoshikimate 1-carboxyvinyltransferase [Tetragenococcus halophilus]AOF48829.1 3-phosphoshikimate 1-carboxyvinyltransferase [Tetragenococcus halophilus]MCF1674962.1 3-phosphoshikimate 1-carboxyvinyltransferase [Tetragenococcus halophilus]MCO8284917.1 3-phosphoshikimate 1-carboxyvinyltransferase [Tetragenococcus halophilus]MCO8285685.1 3-phosphoshikimate 1-carboxyvinyltransferase [Tetragenococcus halophilus]MCO8293469.1 3-phosphoshikimate 1-carboxyvinyltransferase [Tetragenococcus halop
MKLINADYLQGTVEIPPDKSIAHRSIMFGAIAEGQTTIHNFLRAEDCLNTLQAFQALGVPIYDDKKTIRITGVGFAGLKPANSIINVGNSGTTMRLLLGILAGTTFETTLSGDASLNQRPMARVMDPLKQMGAEVTGNNHSEFPPVTVKTNAKLQAIEYHMPIASAQVKSAILFAALQAEGVTKIIEKEVSRNHTEEMITQFGGKIQVKQKTIMLPGSQRLKGQELRVPGDISSAAFFLVAGAIVPNSKITLKNVGLNPTRTGIIDVMQEMGADIQFTQTDQKNGAATLIVKSSELKATTIEGSLIPRVIDELPIIALLATQAEGTTVIKDAQELKVKETNRIDTTAQELKKMGANIAATDDGLVIKGKTTLHTAKVSSHNDHRIGMMLQIAALLSRRDVELENPEAIAVSYPHFFQDIKYLAKRKC